MLTFATVFAYEYRGDHKWVPFASHCLAFVVAASRLSAQKHRISDIFVGGTLGFLVGRYVYKNDHDPALDIGRQSRVETFTPQVGFGSNRVSLAWSL